MTQHAIAQTSDTNFDILYQGSDINHDHGFVLNTLQHITTEHDISKANFWALMRYALNAIKSLQEDLHHARQSISEKDEHIALLEKLATTDPLTGLLNRRGFIDALEKELTKTNRDVSRGGLLVMIDLDNFKMINDTYGHAVGDEALGLVASTLTAHMRKMDTAARLGGDEFFLIFSNAHPIETSARLQKLARKLNNLSLKWNGDRIPIRASLGIHAYEKGDSMEKILNKADTNMYETKRDKQNS